MVFKESGSGCVTHEEAVRKYYRRVFAAIACSKDKEQARKAIYNACMKLFGSICDHSRPRHERYYPKFTYQFDTLVVRAGSISSTGFYIWVPNWRLSKDSNRVYSVPTSEEKAIDQFVYDNWQNSRPLTVTIVHPDGKEEVYSVIEYLICDNDECQRRTTEKDQRKGCKSQAAQAE